MQRYGSAILLVAFGAAVGAQPTVVSTTPANGAKDVIGPVVTIEVKFSQPMKMNSWSLVGTAKGEAIEPEGTPWFSDPQTFHVKARVEPGKLYGVGLNSQTRKGFVSADGKSSLAPFVLYFETAKASAPPAGDQSLLGEWLFQDGPTQVSFRFSPDGTYRMAVKTRVGDAAGGGTYTVAGDTLDTRPEAGGQQKYKWRMPDPNTLELTDSAGTTRRYARQQAAPATGAPTPQPVPAQPGTAPGVTPLRVPLPLPAVPGGHIIYSRTLITPAAAGGLQENILTPKLFVMNGDGSGKQVFLTSVNDFSSFKEARWSPNYDRLAFTSDWMAPLSACMQDIFVASADGAWVRRVTGNELQTPPDKGFGAVTGTIETQGGVNRLQICITAQGADGAIRHPGEITEQDVRINPDNLDEVRRAQRGRFFLPRVAAGRKVWVKLWTTKRIGAVHMVDVQPNQVTDLGNLDIVRGDFGGTIMFSKGSLTPDGRHLVGVSTISRGPTEGSDAICVYDMAQQAVVGLFEPTRAMGEDARDPVVSPDGRLIACVWGRMGLENLAVISLGDLLANRPRPQVLVPSQNIFPTVETGLQGAMLGAGTPAWSPDGRLIAFSRTRSWTEYVTGEICVVGTDGSGARQLTNVGPQRIACQPCFSPDGKHIAFTVVTGKFGPIKPEHLVLMQVSVDVYSVDVQTGQVRQLTNDGISSEPAWGP